MSQLPIRCWAECLPWVHPTPKASVFSLPHPAAQSRGRFVCSSLCSACWDVGLRNEMGWNYKRSYCYRTHWGQSKRQRAETAGGGIGVWQRESSPFIQKEALAQETGKFSVLGCQLTSPRRPSWVSQTSGDCFLPSPEALTQTVPTVALHETVKRIFILCEEYWMLPSSRQHFASSWGSTMYQTLGIQQ